MKLSVIENVIDILTKNEYKKEYIFNFKDGEVLEPLEYFSLFNAKLIGNNNIRISLLREADEENFEEYDSKIFSLTETATFYDKGETLQLALTFKII